MSKSDNQSTEKPIVKVKHHSYQPTKAELEADVGIQASPEKLARRIMSPVTVVETEDA